MSLEADGGRRSVQASTGSPPVPGRLVALTGASLLACAIPLPLLPDRAVRQVRGAIAHDVLSRHGISLASEGRDVFAALRSSDPARALLRKAAELVVRRILRRLGPLAPLTATVAALEVYALGRLLERYAEQVRPRHHSAARSVRMLESEARQVREAIDRSLLRAFHPSLQPTQLLLSEGVEDLRDEFTRWIDTLLLTGATLPSYVGRRLDAAFDQVIDESPELRPA